MLIGTAFHIISIVNAHCDDMVGLGMQTQGCRLKLVYGALHADASMTVIWKFEKLPQISAGRIH